MPGLLVTGTGGKTGAFGIGAEASLVCLCSKGEEPLGYKPPPFGIFGQAEVYNGNHGRYAAGVEVGSILGVEVGYDVREPVDQYARTHGVHIAGYLSLGLVSIALRGSVPVAASGEGASQGGELGVAATLKLPIGNYDAIGIFHGRPPRGGGHVYDACARTPRAAAWLARAADELASVATFVALAVDLDAWGAPAALTLGALRAAREESAHARALVALAMAEDPAARFSARAACPIGASLASIAGAATIDGVFGERAAAGALVAEADACGEGRVRRALFGIARDEVGHANFATRVARWAIERDGRADARAAVARALGAIDALAHEAPGAAYRASLAMAPDGAHLSHHFMSQ
jgi:hypothetical protein